jgi:hypothetical protein
MIKESTIQSEILVYLRDLQYTEKLYFFRSNSGSFKIADSLGKDRFMKTGKKGCPDIILLIWGKFIGIEVKTDKGKISKHQQLACDEIDSAGGIYTVVRSVKELIEDLKTISLQINK